MMLCALAMALIPVTFTDQVFVGSSLMAQTAFVTKAAASAQFTPRCGREACAPRPLMRMQTTELEVWRTAAHMSPAFKSCTGRI